MPVIREYDQQLRAVNRPLSQSADPGTAGAGARGLAQLGQGISNLGDAVFDVAEQNELARYQVAAANARADINAKRKRAQETGAAADPEYVISATQAAEEAAAKLADGMTTRRGQEAVRAANASFVLESRTLAQEDNAVAIGSRAKLAAKEALDINGNTLLGSPELFGAALRDTETYWDGPGGEHIPLAAREQLKRESAQELAVYAVNGTLLKNPKLAQQQLTSGYWDAYLPPDKKLALINRVESKLAEDKGRANLEALLRLQEQADNGILSEAQTLRAFDAGVFQSAAQAMSLYARSKDRALELQRQRQLDVAINLGDPQPLVKYSPKEQQEGFDRFAGKRVLAAQDEPEQQAGAINEIVTRGRELGLISSQMRAQLEGATVSRPEQFVTATKWYDGLRAIDPTYANAHIAPQQAALFNVYLTAKDAGQSDAQALEIVRQAGDPEKMRKFRSEIDKETLSRISSAVSDRGYLPWSKGAANSSWARNSVAEMTKLRMAFGDSNAPDAAKWALEQFKARHVVVGNRWLPVQGAVSPDLAPALEEYLARLPEALKKHGATQDDIDKDGYELRTDRQTAIDGSLQAYSKRSGMSLPGYRVVPEGALSAFKSIKEHSAAVETQRAVERLHELRQAYESDEGAEILN